MPVRKREGKPDTTERWGSVKLLKKLRTFLVDENLAQKKATQSGLKSFRRRVRINRVWKEMDAEIERRT